MVESIDSLDVEIDSVGLSYLAGERINQLMEHVEQHPDDLNYMKRSVAFYSGLLSGAPATRFVEGPEHCVYHSS